jgi:hypothetical protein
LSKDYHRSVSRVVLLKRRKHGDATAFSASIGRVVAAKTLHPTRPASEGENLLETGRAPIEGVVTPQLALAAMGRATARCLLRPTRKRFAIRERGRPGGLRAADKIGNLLSYFLCLLRI